ncbi:zinc finger protein 431-like [Pseudomyrmex gracilis]|uniref:zinc finger protein 431-like n=1 Tax=Pseudomyrmex gracilis TaxID=219809 RepID=UPI0009949951|nr:zinc finger protein 431-like [Pseudomyrmex gracilis]
MELSAQQETTANKFTCDTCDASFATEFALHVHESTHVYNIVCTICNTTVVNTEHLNNHVKYTHPESRYYACVICGTKFATRSELQTHANTHTEKLWKCNYCKKIYLNYSSLNIHKLNKHSELDFTCAICSLEFSSDSELQSHLAHHLH